MQPSPDLLSFDKEEGPTSHRRGVLKYDGTTLSSLHQIARLPTDEMKICEGSMITNLRERIQVSQSQPRGNPKNKVKCLAINQVLRAKIHNSCLLVVYKNMFFILCGTTFYPCLIFSSLSLLTSTCYQPTIDRLSCSGCCLHKSGASSLFLLYWEETRQL